MAQQMTAIEEKLWWVNLVTCFVHLAAILTTVVMWTDWSIPVTTSFISWKMKNETSDMGCGDGNCYVESAFATWSENPDISLLGLVISFHALSFSWQFVALWNGPVRRFYHMEIAKGRNTLRWCEYSLSAPLMIIVISAILGHVDVVVYFLLAVCTSLLMGLGYLQEIFMRDTVVPHIMGWGLFLLTWIPLTFTFAVSLERSPASPPDDVLIIIWATYLLMLILFGCFGIVQTMHVLHHHMRGGIARKDVRYMTLEKTQEGGKKKARESEVFFYKIEWAYAILSATSKLALGVLLIFLIYAREDQVKLEFDITPPPPINNI